jgi:hypothetical protein
MNETLKKGTRFEKIKINWQKISWLEIYTFVFYRDRKSHSQKIKIFVPGNQKLLGLNEFFLYDQQYSTMQYSTIQYSAIQCSAVQCRAVQYSAVQYNAVQYSTLQL